MGLDNVGYAENKCVRFGHAACHTSARSSTIHITSTCIHSKSLSEFWKLDHTAVLPLHKTGHPMETNNYIPVIGLPTLRKLLLPKVFQNTFV